MIINWFFYRYPCDILTWFGLIKSVDSCTLKDSVVDIYGRKLIIPVLESVTDYDAEMTEERAKGILNAIDDDRFLIKVKFIRKDNGNFT